MKPIRIAVLPLMPIIAFLPFQTIQAQQDEGETQIEEIIVTGSHIKRQRAEMAVPVAIYSRSDFEDQGSPMITEIIQNLPEISGAINQSDQFSNSGEITGTKTVNIRGLGLGRTLVLLNGKRLVNQAALAAGDAYPVDIGNFPGIALERIELLKNGGATVYGSDAVAGVFNYITRSDFVGQEIRGAYTDIDGSEHGGDQEIGFIWGVASDTMNWVTSAEWTRRGQLANPMAGLLDYNTPPLDGGWPLGFSSFGNPGSFFALDFSQFQIDPDCGLSIDHFFGSADSFEVTNPIAAAFGNVCGYSYMTFGNTIDPQKRLNVLSEIKASVNDNVELYAEFLYANLDAVYYGSPSYPPTNPGAGFFTYIPPDNPGYADWFAGLDPAVQAGFGAGALWWGRAYAIEGPSQMAPIENKTIRAVFGARGTLGAGSNIDYDVSVNYSRSDENAKFFDVLTERFDLAVNGLGGPDCERASNDPADPANAALRGDTSRGCYFYNVHGTALTGAIPNNPLVRDWFRGTSQGITVGELLTGNAVFSGKAPLELGGGPVAWAFGGQYRNWQEDFNPVGDQRLTPGGDLDSPFHFLGGAVARFAETDTWALFTELSMPFMDNLEVNLGARFEDYKLDSVLNPMISVRYAVTDAIVLRAAYEEAFRTPLLGTSDRFWLAFYAPSGEYLTVITPVPENLDPEESDNWSVGVILSPTNEFTATLDYYSIKLKGPFGEEAPTCTCADLILDANGNVISIITEVINGPDVKTAGVDFSADYVWPAGPGNWSVGLNGNWIDHYTIHGNNVSGDRYEAAGKFNFRSTAAPVLVRSMPDLKFNAHASLAAGDHFISVYGRYISDYEVDPDSTMFGVAGITEIDSQFTVDLHYAYTFREKTRLALSVINVGDEDPPLAPHELGYDAGTHNPLGRTFRVSVQHNFSGN